MAKKRKQKTGSKPKGSHEAADSPVNYDDPKQLADATRKAFQFSLDNVRKMEKDHPNILIQMDLDSPRAKRRSKAVCTYAERVREMVKEFCPDIPDVFSISTEWAHINAMPITTYDHQEGSMFLILGAAIWMLDHIKQNGKIREAINLLPKDEDLLEDVSIPVLYDPVHREEVIRAMVYAVEQRNIDCEIQGTKRSRKKAQRPDPVDRYFMDIATVMQSQHQEVASRKRFETLLSLIPQEDIDAATAHYEEKLFEWVRCYFRCRATYCKREQELEERRARFEETAMKRFQSITGEMEKPKVSPNLGAKPPLSILNQSTSLPQKNRLEQMMSDPIQLLEYLDEESQQLDIAGRNLLEETNKLAYFSHRLTDASYDLIKRDYGTTIADIMTGFEPGDPYEMCFALLYLLDQDSDLPWLYYPGTMISEYAGSMLPWYTVEYDELDDDHWAQYYDPELRAKPAPIKNPPELADWYSLDYMPRTSDPDFQQRTNLAQIVYEFTGGIMPRDLHRYDDALKHMRHYGVTGKKVQIPLLYSMLLLGEGMHQSQDWRLEYNFPDDVFASLIDSIKKEADAEDEPEPDGNPYESELAALKEENARLKRLAYEADRESRDLRKQYDALLVKSQGEHQELSELREILFNQENDLEVELEDDAEDIVLPYKVNRTTVIFGGHDTWAKAIKPMLTGDIRFVDRDMRPDADLIRHADVVWLQPNSISHAFYYKIINIIRTYKIPLHYFKFASAEKCAKQLASADISHHL